MKSCNTNVAVKQKNLPAFIELIEHQLAHGGVKYSLGEDREFTDLLAEFDPSFILVTIMKYCGRYRTFRREKDLLKIATYAYLQWLKDGHHLVSQHDEDTDKGV